MQNGLTIPMVDLRRSHRRLQAPIEEALQKVVRSTRFILGEEVAAFEAAFARYLAPEGEVIGCNSGTDALLLALTALELPQGAEVIVPDFTFVATAEVVVRAGLEPVFADVDPVTFCIDPRSVEALLSPRTAAIIPVHLFGLTAPMEPLLEIAHQHGLKVIEDTAQATGARYRFADGTVRLAGTIGDVGCFSFFPSKNLGGYGDGGAVFTRDAELARRIRSLRNHGQYQRYHYEAVGFNSRLDALQAAVLNVKLPHLDTFNAERQAAAEHYTTLLQPMNMVHPPHTPPYSTHVFHQYTLRVDARHRDALISHLKAHSIAAQVYYPMRLSDHPPYRRYRSGNNTVSRQLASEVVSLPMFPELRPQEIEYISHHIQRYFSQ